MKHRGDPLSAGVVVIRDTPEGQRFLLLRAYNHWDFPKGKVEEGEHPLEAARREVTEETTITDLDLSWGERYTETGPYNRGKVARYYLGVTTQEEVQLPVNPELGEPEHSEYRWVSLSEAWQLASPRVRQVLRWVARQTGEQLPPEARRRTRGSGQRRKGRARTREKASGPR